MCHGVRFVSLTWCISRMNSFPVFVCFPPFVFAPSILGSLNWFFAFFHWFLFLLLDFKKWLVLDYLPIVFNSILFSFCLSPGSSAVKCLLLFFLDRTFLKAPMIIWRLQKCNCSQARKSKQKEMNIHVIIPNCRRWQYKKRKKENKEKQLEEHNTVDSQVSKITENQKNMLQSFSEDEQRFAWYPLKTVTRVLIKLLSPCHLEYITSSKVTVKLE